MTPSSPSSPRTEASPSAYGTRHHIPRGAQSSSPRRHANQNTASPTYDVPLRTGHGGARRVGAAVPPSASPPAASSTWRGAGSSQRQYAPVLSRRSLGKEDWR